MPVDRLDNDGLLFDEFKISFDATSSSVVSTSSETITHTDHGFVTGDSVKYFKGVSGSAIGGLVEGTEYFVIRMDNNILKLAASYSNAISGTPIDITSVASGGTAHILTKSNSILFKIFQGNYPVGSVYVNKSSSANPNTYLSGGGHAVWSSIIGRVIVGVGAGSDGTDSINFGEDTTGGKYNHTLDIDEMPSHRHQFKDNEGNPYNAISDNNLRGTVTGVVDSQGPRETGNDTGVTQTRFAGGSGSDSDGDLASAGATQSHNNIQPYQTAYMWERTA